MTRGPRRRRGAKCLVAVASMLVGGYTCGKSPPGKPTIPAVTPSSWSLDEMVGLYGMHCAGGDMWAEYRLRADATFASILHGRSGEFTGSGPVAREGDRLTLVGPGDVPSDHDVMFMRSHRGRRMLVPKSSIEAFDLLPSWSLGYVAMKSGEKRFSLCRQIHQLSRNPPDPSDPKVRLPASFEVELQATRPGADPTTTRIEITSAPHWARMAVCRDCATPTDIDLDRNTWARLNRRWWASNRGSEACPSPGDADEGPAFTITWKAGRFAGALPRDVDSASAASSHCRARADLAQWVAMRVATMHPP